MYTPSLDGNWGEYALMREAEAQRNAPPSAQPSILSSAPPITKPSTPSITKPSIPSITKPSAPSITQPSRQPSTQARTQDNRPPRIQPPRIQPPRIQPPRIQPPREQPQPPFTPEQRAFKESLHAVAPERMIDKINRQVVWARNNPQPKPGVTAEDAATFTVSVATDLSTLAITGTKLILREWPRQAVKLVKEIAEEVKKNDAVATPNGLPTNRLLKSGMTKVGGMTGTMPGTMTGTMPGTMTGGMKIKIKQYNKMLFGTTYIPGALTLLIFFYLVLVMWWSAIQRILNIINKYIGTKLKLPSIMLKKKTAQTIYSIFFVITSWFLMLYLFIDYFRNVGPELDIVQIFKQLIGASYLLWPMAILIIGSGIAKAFYKMSCNGNKPNVVSWAKIVESSALYVLGIAILFTVIFLFKPVKYIYEKFPELVKDRFNFVFVMVSVTLKLMVIYILLRMITIMIENIISSKIIFFLSKLNNDIEPPPVDCNAEKEEKEKKQSEIAKILEEIYMYISGIIMYIILVFFIVIQCPHPWFGTVVQTNHTIGAVWLQLTDISTRFIVENSYGRKSAGKKKGFFSFRKMPFRKGAEVPPSDNSGAEGYKNRFKKSVGPDGIAGEDFLYGLSEQDALRQQVLRQKEELRQQEALGEQKALRQREALIQEALRQQASTSAPPQGRYSAVQPDLMQSQRLTKPEAGLESGVTRDTPEKINNKDAPVGAFVDFGREEYAENFSRQQTAPAPIATSKAPQRRAPARIPVEVVQHI